MELHKYFKRKYSKSYDRLIKDFSPDLLEMIKQEKFNVGYSENDINVYTADMVLPKNTLFIYRKTNPITDDNYPSCYICFSVDERINDTGVLVGLYITNSDVIHLTN